MGVELVFDRVDGARPERAIAFLHGILGRGNNLRSLAKSFIEARPTWTAWLVDLRGHGQSPKRTPDPSVSAAAKDVVDLVRRNDPPLCAIVGHSFGGKVALETARIGLFPSLDHIVVMDSAPGVQRQSQDAAHVGDDAVSVIDAIASLPKGFASKGEFIAALLAAGKDRTLAQWLATSLEKHEDHFRFALDLNEIRGLIMDYLARDLWPVVTNPPGKSRVHLIIGERSRALSTEDRQRAAQLAAAGDRITVDVLPAGHWLHVDDPQGTLNKLLQHVGP